MTTALSDLLLVLDGLLEPSETSATLAAAISSTSATTFTVANSQYPVNPGDLVEVDNELMRVSAISRVSGSTDTVTVTRGANGSTAATHSNGAAIRVNPKFPRWRRIQALNLAYTDWTTTRAPMVTVASDQTFSATSNVVSVPATTLEVLKVEYAPVPGWVWLERLPHGRPRDYPTTLVSTGRGVPLAEVGPSGYTAYVTYTSPWSPALSADTDTLAASWPFGTEMLAQGATAHLLGAKFVKRSGFDAAQAQRDEQKQTPTLTQLAGRDALARYMDLLEQGVQTWPGSRSPIYLEP